MKEEREAYEGFAAVYDMFMEEIPYEKWLDNIKQLLTAEGIEDGLVLELGCGTGNATRLLSDAGYDMIGVDNAPDMLEIALEKKDCLTSIVFFSVFSETVLSICYAPLPV